MIQMSWSWSRRTEQLPAGTAATKELPMEHLTSS